jgi:hypothetical protein
MSALGHSVPTQFAAKHPYDRNRPPLRPKHIWSIRTRLLVEGRIRDLALFNLAIDCKLRGCDVAAVKVEDVAPNGYTMDRATLRQKKTGRPVKQIAANSGRFALNWEISVCAGPRGGAGRTRTSNQTIISHQLTTCATSFVQLLLKLTPAK